MWKPATRNSEGPEKKNMFVRSHRCAVYPFYRSQIKYTDQARTRKTFDFVLSYRNFYTITFAQGLPVQIQCDVAVVSNAHYIICLKLLQSNQCPVNGNLWPNTKLTKCQRQKGHENTNLPVDPNLNHFPVGVFNENLKSSRWKTRFEQSNDGKIEKKKLTAPTVREIAVELLV